MSWPLTFQSNLRKRNIPHEEGRNLCCCIFCLLGVDQHDIWWWQFPIYSKISRFMIFDDISASQIQQSQPWENLQLDLCYPRPFRPCISNSIRFSSTNLTFYKFWEENNFFQNPKTLFLSGPSSAPNLHAFLQVFQFLNCNVECRLEQWSIFGAMDGLFSQQCMV